jgi:hypothetical protein
MNARYKSVYSRLESDEEFRRRLDAADKLYGEGRYYCSDKLDEWVWEKHQMQRRIVEDVC